MRQTQAAPIHVPWYVRLRLCASLCGVVIMCALSSSAFAQHPIEVERLQAQGEHLRAMVAFDRLPERRVTTSATIAVAKSAWALGLSSWAADAFDKVLRDPKLGSDQRARILFSRAVMELQNDKPQLAAMFSERSAELLKNPSPLRAQVYALWGKSLMRSGQPGGACDLLARAVPEADQSQLPALHYDLAQCLRKLGKFEEARDMLEQIPLEDERAPKAVRALALIALDLKNYEHADFWLEKGRTLFPTEFLDSWVDYARMVVATEQGNTEQVETLLQSATETYPPSDSWFQLLRATAEQCLWKNSRSASKENTL